MELLQRIQRVMWTISKRQALFFALLVVSGALLAFMLRFVLVKHEEVHYHANFAVYVDGKRDSFESQTFYEEVASCSDSYNNPKGRAHMHDLISHVVHVHDDAVTWGQFFENISYGLTRESFTNDDGTFIDGQNGKKLTFILNGNTIGNAANKVIQTEDVLLVDYSASSESEIATRYEQITKDAAEYNKRDDPSACKGGKDEPFKDRFLRTLGVDTDH